jgi:hypothetical protein
VILVHYDDLSSDLDGQMRRLAGLLGIEVAEETWPDLVRAATFEQMRARARAQVPDTSGILKDPAAFFRRGCGGAGHEELESAELARYYARAEQLAPPDLLAWLHRDSAAGFGQGVSPMLGWPAWAGEGRNVSARDGRNASADHGQDAAAGDGMESAAAG